MRRGVVSLSYNRQANRHAICSQEGKFGRQLHEVALQYHRQISAGAKVYQGRLLMNKQEVELLSKEVEMLMNERARLLRVVGAAAVLVANTDAETLPEAMVDAAEELSEALNALPEETLKDALESVHAVVE